MTVVEMIIEMKRVKELLDDAKNVKTNFQKQFDAIRLGVLPEKMEDDDTSNITVKDVGRAVVKSDIYFSILAENRDECYQWLRDNGHGDLIKETVNAGTGKSFAKEMIKEGKPLPEIFKVTPFTSVQLTIKI